ncbi:MAG TPA: glycosyltransferase family 4 protein [Candidatus Eisenbacteria bacterium]|nr:glycosyltransferase family 4 protein [Candidatus Eisenbacteria bacterium]
MRVVDIVNLSSSAHSLLKERVLALRASGVDNRILCMDGPYVAALREAGIPVHTVPLPRGLHPWRLARATAEIARYLRRERIDVVHTHCSVPGAVGRVAAWLAHVPVIVHTVHGFHFHEGTHWTKRLPFLTAERLCGRITDTLLTQNQSDLDLAERFGIGPEERRRRIGNGIDLSRFSPRPGASRAPGEPFVVTCVARFEPVKNHNMLFEAVRLLHAEGIPLRLQLVGEGAGLSRARRRVVDLGLEGAVDFLGYRDDIPRLLAGTDVAVLTSRKEGIPRAVLEAMAMAVPVVATWVPGTREALRPGETGLAVELDDVQGLADALRTLFADPELRRRLGEAGRRVALEEFDERPIAEALQKIYGARLASREAKRAAWVPRRSEHGLRADSRPGR